MWLDLSIDTLNLVGWLFIALAVLSPAEPNRFFKSVFKNLDPTKTYAITAMLCLILAFVMNQVGRFWL